MDVKRFGAMAENSTNLVAYNRNRFTCDTALGAEPVSYKNSR